MYVPMLKGKRGKPREEGVKHGCRAEVCRTTTIVLMSRSKSRRILRQSKSYCATDRDIGGGVSISTNSWLARVTSEHRENFNIPTKL